MPESGDPAKRIPIRVDLDQALAKSVRTAAEADHRTTSGHVRHVLIKALELERRRAREPEAA